jgi:hypothetical protein
MHAAPDLGAKKNIRYNLRIPRSAARVYFPGLEHVLTALTIINRAGHGIWVRIVVKHR